MGGELRPAGGAGPTPAAAALLSYRHFCCCCNCLKIDCNSSTPESLAHQNYRHCLALQPACTEGKLAGLLLRRRAP